MQSITFHTCVWPNLRVEKCCFCVIIFKILEGKSFKNKFQQQINKKAFTSIFWCKYNISQKKSGCR